jgi:hypothetical protein
MKQNIEKVKYDEHLSSYAKWWTWDEYCNKCGKLITFKGLLLHSYKPEKDIDYCLDCCYEILDNK